MFGIGFTEMLVIGVIAILFLGPDKLPEAMIQIAKFFNSAKRTITSAKSSIEEELHVAELKEEALRYKQEMLSAQEDLSKMTDMNDITHEIDELKDVASVDLKKEIEQTPTDSPYAQEESHSTTTPEPTADEVPKEPTQAQSVTFTKNSKRKKVIETDEEDV